MKIRNRKVFGIAAVTAAMFSTSAWAYIPQDYCGRLGNSWGDWLDYIAMCI